MKKRELKNKGKGKIKKFHNYRKNRDKKDKNNEKKDIEEDKKMDIEQK